ncbi:MAG: VWA domain-containing protein [Terracidiphilus sp.]
MKRGSGREVLCRENGQVLPWLVLLLGIFLGLCALTVDVGRGLLVRRQLQASADAAALAAALTLPNSSYATVGQAYSSAVGSKNAYFGYTVATPVITARCSTTVAGPPWNIPCTSTSPNVVTVTETATVSTFFAGVLGIPKLTVNVESTASKGAKPQPYNVAIILDSTNSMNNKDPNCSNQTQLQCAENAIAIILAGLAPTEDHVSLFTFPAMVSTSAQNDSNCSGTQATGAPYTFPSTTASTLQTMPYTTTHSGRHGTTSTTVQTTYEISGYQNNYRTSDTATSLSSSSPLTSAIGSSKGCSGLVPNTTQNTYFAATIYAAQASLLAEQAANPGTNNAIIMLSDGNANAVNNGSFSDMATSTQSTVGVNNSSDGKYPNLQGECGQSVDAAAAATAAGTLFFTIAYGSPSTSTSGGGTGNQGNCASDIGTGQHPNITPCQDMQQMSSGWNSTPRNTSHFYSDYYAPGGDSGCQAADANNTVTSLNNIAASIVGQLSGARLIPNGTN